MPKVDLVPHKNALLPQSAHQVLDQVHKVVNPKVVHQVALVFQSNEQTERSYYETHN